MLKAVLQELWDQTMDLADSLPFETTIVKAIFVTLELPLVYMSALIGYLAAMADSWIAGMRRD